MGIFDKITGNSTIDPVKEFGVELTKLVEIALSDKILASSERTMLRGLAASRNVDVARFETYINSMRDKHGVKEIKDGEIPLKKYEQTSGVSKTLKNMIDMALADGYLSDEERKIILAEAAKLKLNLAAFEQGLNAIFMTDQIKKVIDSKYPSTVTKRLVNTENTPDGKVIETYEEIHVTFRPNTNRGKEGQLLKTTTKKIIKVTRNSDDSIDSAIEFLCSVNYSTLISALSVVSVFAPVVGGIAVSLITSLQTVTDKYKQAGKKDKELFLKIFVGETSLDKCVEVFPQVKKYLGANGDKLIACLTAAQQEYAK